MTPTELGNIWMVRRIHRQLRDVCVTRLGQTWEETQQAQAAYLESLGISRADWQRAWRQQPATLIAKM